MLKFGIIGLWIRSAVTGPLGFALFFSTLYFLARWVKKKKTGKGFKATHVALAFSGCLLFCSFPYPAFLLEKPLLTWADRLAAAAEINERDGALVIFVLGGGISNKTGMPSSYTLARIAHGVDLYYKHPDAYVLFSDGGLAGQNKTGWMMTYLEASGIPRSRVLLEDQALSTQQNIINGKKLLEAKNLNSQNIVLITSASHIPRAVLTARKYGLTVIPEPVPEKASLTCYPSWHSTVRLSAVLHEYLGILGYKLLGWL
ncbi:MAG: YdcF family protein [Lentisphaeria bacterium]|nr:YdcF family protein [Lentisphaeria bacterium]